MKSIVGIAIATLLASTAAQAEIICTNRGCWETGMKIFRNGGVYAGLPYYNHRNTTTDNSFYPKPNPQQRVRIIRETW
jgi:hypothetical protein